MRRRAFLAAAASAGAAAGLAGCVGAAGGLSEDEYDVGMSASRFLPPAYEVAAGTTVVWGNSGSRTHTVTAYEGGIPDDAGYFASGGFDSEAAARTGWQDDLAGGVDPGETYAHTFEVPGTHRYFCIPHEPAGMVGKVVVLE